MRHISLLLLLAAPATAATLCEIPNPTADGLDGANICQRAGGCTVHYRLTLHCAPGCTYIDDVNERTVRGFPFGSDAINDPDFGCPNVVSQVDASANEDEFSVIFELLIAGDLVCRNAAPQFPEDVVGITGCNTADVALLRTCNLHRRLVRLAMPRVLYADGDDFNLKFRDCAAAIATNFWGTTGGPEVNKTSWLNVHGGNPSGWDRVDGRVGTLTGILPQLDADVPGTFDEDGEFTPCPDTPKGCEPRELQ